MVPLQGTDPGPYKSAPGGYDGSLHCEKVPCKNTNTEKVSGTYKGVTRCSSG